MLDFLIDLSILIFIHFVDGQYLYINGHEFINTTLSAEIRSPELYILDNTTVTFWYHMNGVGVGELRVVLIDRYGGSKVVWVKSGRQGSGWHQGMFLLEDLTASVNIPLRRYINYA